MSTGRPPLTQDIKNEIIRLYGEGLNLPQVAAKLGIGTSSVHRCVKDADRNGEAHRRGNSEAQLLKHGRDPELMSISSERWRELYSGLGSGYPSVSQLAKRFGVTPPFISERLKASGITPRSLSEQMKLEFKTGRRTHPKNANKNWGPWIESIKSGWTALSKNERARRIRRLTVGLEGYRKRISEESRVMMSCGWCGNPKETIRHLARKRPIQFCSRSHASKHARFRSYYGPDAPRPLIVEKLTELAEKNRGWAETPEQLAKLGQQIGAREPEILEVLTRDVGEGS